MTVDDVTVELATWPAVKRSTVWANVGAAAGATTMTAQTAARNPKLTFIADTIGGVDGNGLKVRGPRRFTSPDRRRAQTHVCGSVSGSAFSGGT